MSPTPGRAMHFEQAVPHAFAPRPTEPYPHFLLYTMRVSIFLATALDHDAAMLCSTSSATGSVLMPDLLAV